ncbi:hypothetical protein EDC90_1006133 [Martelella mediterranea]|uniref:Uncharacterized protein n=2 Tax=Alphaproteobacteria TaxID=28211 RepID=A0A4R3P2Z6_9HYPH|nr:hypothetical protein EDC90_1006133 [Martelella mediterranea]
MAMRLLTALARRAEVPVFPVVGARGLARVETLRRRPGLRLVDSPRHARVLLVAGEVAPAHKRALERLHAQLPAPRGTVWWQGSPLGSRLFERGETVAGDDPLEAIRRAAHAGDPDQRPDVPPHPWERPRATPAYCSEPGSCHQTLHEADNR